MMRSILLLLMSLTLASCGFHFRGAIDVPEWLNNIAVMSQDGNKELVSLIKSQLEGYKIAVNPDPARATYWLIVNRSAYEQKIISIGASTNPRQYQMRLTTEFVLRTRRGELMSPAEHIEVTRQLTVNNDRILGSNDEEVTLLREMRLDTVIQMINRLSRIPDHAH